MLGPLPKVYRLLVSVVAIVVFIAIGAWLAFTLPIPVLASVGAGIGAGIGLIAVFLILHDFHRTEAARPQRAHARRPR